MEILVLSLLAGLATTFGGLLVVIQPSFSEKALAALLGGAGGVMAGVVLLDLLPSAWKLGGFAAAVEGFSLGILFIFLLDRLFSFFMPASQGERNSFYLLNMGYLIAVGIALHDLPEGIAIAVGYAAESQLGLILVVAIALHNIPEGMATAAPLLMGGMSSKRIMIINGIVSLFTPMGTIIGLMLLKISPQLIALLLATAAGAMTYIVRFELIPESRRRHPNYSLLGVFIGIVLSTMLAIAH